MVEERMGQCDEIRVKVEEVKEVEVAVKMRVVEVWEVVEGQEVEVMVVEVVVVVEAGKEEVLRIVALFC